MLRGNRASRTRFEDAAMMLATLRSSQHVKIGP